MNRLALCFLRLYRLALSPLPAFFGAQCRFHPTCSSYGMQLYQSHPFWTASLLLCKRLGRCHPWHPGGIDPVPGHEQGTY